MPNYSVIAAVQEKFAGLTAANFPGGVLPKLHFDEAPATDAGGAQIDPEAGYVVLKDEGQTPTYFAFERATHEAAAFVFDIYYPSLGDCDLAARAIRLNGGTAAQAIGFDGGMLTTLAAPRAPFAIRRTFEQRGVAGLSKTGKRMHICRLKYTIEVQEVA